LRYAGAGLTASRTIIKSRTLKSLILPLNFTLDVDNSTSTNLNNFFFSYEVIGAENLPEQFFRSLAKDSFMPKRFSRQYTKLFS
jgi:hypothetical protein